MDGLNFIQREGYGHGSLSCESVLVNNEGYVKVGGSPIAPVLFEAYPLIHTGGQELCQITSAELQAKNILDFGKVMIKLMQKLVRKDGTIGIDDPGRWQDNPDTIQFASSITSARSTEELRRVSQ